MTVFTMTPREVRAGIIACFGARLVPFVTSSPGLGKSSIFAKIAEDFQLELIDLRLSQCAPEDLMGLPMKVGDEGNPRATFVPFKTFPLKGDTPPPGKVGWLLLLDEFNSAPKSVQAAAYKVVLDRMVGQAELHEDCFVGAAGNLATDNAIVNAQSTAMQSRLIHMQMEADHEAFMDYAVAAGWDSRVLAFLEFQPARLHKFDPDHTDRTFPCPRTWEFVSKLVKGQEIGDVNLKLLAGAVGDGAAQEFYTFLQVFRDLPSYAEIAKDPENAGIPRNPGSRYAVILMLLDRFTRTGFADVAPYVKRLDPEFQVIYFRGVKRKDLKFIKDPVFVKMRKDLTNFLTEDDVKAAA